MGFYLVKLFVSAALIVVVSEISKRTGFWGGVVASLPLVSVISMIWIYVETKDVERLASFSTSVFWFVLPSLALFIVLPVLLRMKMGFPASLGLSIAASFVAYIGMAAALNRAGIKF